MNNSLKKALILNSLMDMADFYNFEVYVKFEDPAVNHRFYVIIVDIDDHMNTVKLMWNLNDVNFEEDEFKKSMKRVEECILNKLATQRGVMSEWE